MRLNSVVQCPGPVQPVQSSPVQFVWMRAEPELGPSGWGGEGMWEMFLLPSHSLIANNPILIFSTINDLSLPTPFYFPDQIFGFLRRTVFQCNFCNCWIQIFRSCSLQEGCGWSINILGAVLYFWNIQPWCGLFPIRSTIWDRFQLLQHSYTIWLFDHLICQNQLL